MASTDLEIEKTLHGSRKRKLTEARRTQNREAQRVWREKQKQKRDHDIKVKVLQALQQTTSALNEHDKFTRSCEVRQAAPTQNAGFSSSLTGATASEITHVPLSSSYSFQSSPLGNSNQQSDSANVWSEQVTPLQDPDLPLGVAVYYYAPTEPGYEDMRHLWPVPEGLALRVYQKPPSTRAPPGMRSEPTYPGFHNFSSHQTSSPLTPMSSLSHLHSGQSEQAGAVYASYTTSPYLNYLQLVGESCFSATLAIAESLGISRPAYINDHPSPLSTESNYEIHRLPKDLRPSGYQLILPHPCYLDCIPFPHFRSVAVYLSSMRKLDHMSLFLDLIHDGLVCWGRSKANGGYGRSMSDGVPWSKRSWEARPWFWRKWGWIARANIEQLDTLVPSESHADDEIDDEDGMLSSSQWWWSVNGESDDFLPTTYSETMQSDDQAVEEEFGVLLSRTLTCNVGIRNKKDVVPWD